MLITVNDVKVRSESHSSIYLIFSFLFQSLLSLFPLLLMFFFLYEYPNSVLGKKPLFREECVFACLLASFSFSLEVTGCEAG